MSINCQNYRQSRSWQSVIWCEYCWSYSLVHYDISALVTGKLDNDMFLQEESLWACLAAMAAYAKQLEVAEVAYAAIDEVC